MTDDLSKLPWLVGHAKRTLSIVRQNIVFALGVKAVFVILTFAGFATLWGAIAADVGASLLVVANALRLLRPGGSLPRLGVPREDVMDAMRSEEHTSERQRVGQGKSGSVRVVLG